MKQKSLAAREHFSHLRVHLCGFVLAQLAMLLLFKFGATSGMFMPAVVLSIAVQFATLFYAFIFLDSTLFVLACSQDTPESDLKCKQRTNVVTGILLLLCSWTSVPKMVEVFGSFQSLSSADVVPLAVTMGQVMLFAMAIGLLCAEKKHFKEDFSDLGAYFTRLATEMNDNKHSTES